VNRLVFTFDLQNVKIYKPQFDFVFNEPTGSPVGRYMRRRTIAAAAMARAKVGVRTGRLKAAITWEMDRKGAGGAMRSRIGTLRQVGPRGYARLHHSGTRPHVITTRKGRYMHFTVKGRRVTTRLVKHPGTRPNHYLTDTFVLWKG
jgi:hypothetical protein